MSAMKRSRSQEYGQVEAAAMANCLMLLSKLNDKATSTNQDHHHNDFECKTCNKRFPSFQALGGHRASHKRPKLLGEFLAQSKKNNKMHACAICGMEFSLGQALGGHMRRHRATVDDMSATAGKTMTMIPVLKKSNSSKRIFCVDLNLSPHDENVDLKLWPTAPVQSPVLRIFI